MTPSNQEDYLHETTSHALDVIQFDGEVVVSVHSAGLLHDRSCITCKATT